MSLHDSVSDIQIPTTSTGDFSPPVSPPSEVESSVSPVSSPPVTYKITCISVDLLDGAVKINLENGTYKLSSYSDFIDRLKTSVQGEEKLDAAGIEVWTPPGTFYINISKSITQICTYYPESIRDVNYAGVIRKSVTPNIIVSNKLSKGTYDKTWTVSDTRYFATEKPLPELTRRFYTAPGGGIHLLPFTNVYETGRLCMGGNVRIPTITPPDFRPLHSYFTVLFDSPFNNDLGLTALKDEYRRDIPKWYALLAECAEKGNPFPYSKLRPV